MPYQQYDLTYHCESGVRQIQQSPLPQQESFNTHVSDVPDIFQCGIFPNVDKQNQLRNIEIAEGLYRQAHLASNVAATRELCPDYAMLPEPGPFPGFVNAFSWSDTSPSSYSDPPAGGIHVAHSFTFNPSSVQQTKHQQVLTTTVEQDEPLLQAHSFQIISPSTTTTVEMDSGSWQNVNDYTKAVGLNGDEKLVKRQSRYIKARDNGYSSKIQKKNHVLELERKVRHLTAMNQKLTEELATTRHINMRLQTELDSYRRNAEDWSSSPSSTVNSNYEQGRPSSVYLLIILFFVGLCMTVPMDILSRTRFASVPSNEYAVFFQQTPLFPPFSILSK